MIKVILFPQKWMTEKKPVVMLYSTLNFRWAVCQELLKVDNICIDTPSSLFALIYHITTLCWHSVHLSTNRWCNSSTSWIGTWYTCCWFIKKHGSTFVIITLGKLIWFLEVLHCCKQEEHFYTYMKNIFTSP